MDEGAIRAALDAHSIPIDDEEARVLVPLVAGILKDIAKLDSLDLEAVAPTPDFRMEGSR